MRKQSEVERKPMVTGPWLLPLLVIMCTAGGCAMRGPQPSTPAAPPPEAHAVRSTPGAPVQAEAAKAPSPTRRPALSVHADCSDRDETGYVESIKLAVESGRVDLLEAKIDIPRRGSCQFHLADFLQTRTAPHVELHSHSGSACTVRMWEQGDRFTVAFSNCHEKCTRDAFDYVWPVELNARSGTCL